MEKLIAQWQRLYLHPLAPREALDARCAAHLRGEDTVSAGAENGTTRVIVLAFDKQHDGGDGHWRALCDLASILQVQSGFPAPAVSVSGAAGYRLWLSLEAPIPVAEARRFIEQLHRVHGVGLASLPGACESHPLPPCLDTRSGRWAAFIHPGMGASFADEPGLEIAPPLPAQAAFMEGLESIGLAQFRQALQALEPAAQARSGPAPHQASQPPAAGTSDTLLLRDATLEDIVRHLHARGIEPSLRHVLKDED